VTDAVSEDPNAARLAQLLTEGGIKALNPHISYTEHRRRGYAVAEFRPGEMLVELRSPESVSVPESPVSTLARFRVPREEPRVEAV
jgi:hypothetical protein